MSLIPNQTNVNKDSYFFLLVDSKVITTSTITGNTGFYDKLYTNSLSTNNISSFNISGYNNYLDYIKNITINTNLLNLDSNAVTASNGDLYINGVLVATPGEVSTIDLWARYPAVANINANYSTIQNALGISSLYLSTSLIDADSIKAIGGKIDTLYGLDQINYPKARFEDLSANEIRTSSIYTNSLLSENIYNQYEVSSYSVYADLGVYQQLNSSNINANYIEANNTVLSNSLRAKSVSTINISTNFIEADESYIRGAVISTLVVQYLGAIDSLIVNKNALVGGALRANTISTGTLGSKDIFATDIYSALVSTNTVRADQGFITALDVGILTTDNLFVVDDIFCLGITNTSTLKANNISSLAVSTQTIYADLGTFSSINTYSISSGNIFVSSINSSNGVFDNLYTNNIYNTSNIDTNTLNATNSVSASNITASNSATINNPTLDGYIQANATLNFGFQDNPILPDQFLYDVNNVRNLSVEQITVLGGGTGNLIPLRNNSIVTIGENEITPGTVTINGINISEEPSVALTVDGVTNLLGATNVTGILTAEGDLNVLGVLTAEGDANITGDVSIEGGLEVVGVADLLGNTNVGGVLTVTGETNLLGAVTAEAGIGVVGAVGVTGGDVTFGSALNTGNTFTSYYYTDIKNNLQVDSNINTNSLKATGLSTNTLSLYTTIDNQASIVFSDVSNNIFGAIQDAGVNQLLVASLGDIILNSVSTISLASGNNLGLFAIENINMASQNDINITSFSSINVKANLINIDAPVGVSSILVAPIIGVSTIVGLYNNPIKIDASITADNLSTTNISTSQIYTKTIYTETLGQPNGFVPTPIRVNNELNLQNNSIFNINNLSATNIVASTISTTLTTTSTIATDYLIGLANSNITYTNSLYPKTATGSLGFYSATGSAGGGWYNSINSRSTNTRVITPDTNNILTIRGFVSTQEIAVSTLRTTNIFDVLNISTVRNGTLTVSNINTVNLGGVVNVTNGLFPANPNIAIGFGGGGNPAGRFSVVASYSTFTNTIIPTFPSGNIASTVLIQATVSAPTAFINTINTSFLNPFPASRVTCQFIQTSSSNTGQLGNSGSPYAQVFFNSTITNTIQPFTAIGSLPSRDINSTVTITNTISTQNIQVSTINRKAYPFTSTLDLFGGAGVSTYTISGTTATIPQVLISNITFPYPGNYLITQKNTITKSSGGAGAEPYGLLSLSRGLYPSTFSSADGFNSIPFINATAVSTFNTYTTSIYVSSNAPTRFLTYYDQSGHNYNLNMAIADIRIRYIPTIGLEPELNVG